MKTVEDVQAFISTRPHIVRLLEAVERLQLPDAWIAAGLIRNAVWKDCIQAGLDQNELRSVRVDQVADQFDLTLIADASD